MPSLRSNFIYSALLTGSNYLFPLLVYPYVSRVLGLENIGLVGFIDSIVTYFILFSMMGVSVLGIRETARARGDRIALGVAFRSIVAIHTLVMAAALVLMVAATALVPLLRANAPMMGVGVCKLVFNVFLVEWYFRGMEDFRYVTVRTLVVKTGYALSVFLLVRSVDDTLVYYVLTMAVVAANALLNMSRAASRVPLFGPVDIRRYLKPYFALGAYMLMCSAYTTLNVALLGFLRGDAEVGCYTTATKIFSIIMAVYMAAAEAMLPRMTLIASGSREQKMRLYFRRSVAAVLIFCLPLTACVEAFAPQIVSLLCGPGYEGAVLPVRIMMPFMAVAGIEQIIVLQVLTPLGNDRMATHAAAVGAGTGLLLNALLVAPLGASGSALVWAAAESAVLLFLIRHIGRQYPHLLSVR